MTTSNDNERFTGHGAEWRDSDLSATDARAATAWVEQRIDKRSMETNKDRVEDVGVMGLEFGHGIGERRGSIRDG